MRIGQTIVVKQNANNSELQRAIEAIIPAATKQAASIANRYKGKNEAETCKKIFDYLKNNINYKADGTDQAVRLPSGLMRTLQGDCKSYSVFTSAILSNLGIPHELVYASYDPKDPTPTHIYVMTKSGCIIDAVYGKFNAEKKATYKKYKDMNISYISGMNKTRRIGNMGRYGTGGACGIGATESGLEWAKRNGILPYQSELWLAANSGIYRKYAAQKALPLAAIGRGFVRKLIEKNSGGFANALYKTMVASRTAKPTDEAYKKMRAIEIQWLENGGNPNELYESINEGNSKTPTGAKFNEILKKKASGGSVSVGEWIQAAISAVFGKKYDPSTGKITGSDIGIGQDPGTAGAAVASAPWWATLIAGVVTTLGLAAIGGASPAPGEIIDNQGGGQGGEGTQSNFAQSGLLPILLIGGAAAAYFILKPSKK
jgi:hypothetical protein